MIDLTQFSKQDVLQIAYDLTKEGRRCRHKYFDGDKCCPIGELFHRVGIHNDYDLEPHCAFNVGINGKDIFAFQIKFAYPSMLIGLQWANDTFKSDKDFIDELRDMAEQRNCIIKEN